jgi:hypothetical protein
LTNVTQLTISQMGRPIVPLDISFPVFGQNGQWFCQMGHPIVPLHVHVFVNVSQHEQDQYICVIIKFQKYVNFYCI